MISAYIPLHYGKEYLRESVLSFIDLVDELHILYDTRPSHSATREQNPDRKEELYQIVKDNAGAKMQWHEVSTHNEQQQRALIHNFAKHNQIFTSDADEVWDTQNLDTALKQAANAGHKVLGVDGFIHLWKSFNYRCLDWFRPHRFINKKGRGIGEIKCRVWHFGYAQSREVIKYKLSCHGHKHELKYNYLTEIYDKWTKENNGSQTLHPTSYQIWQKAEPYDKTEMSELLKKHKNYNKECI